MGNRHLFDSMSEEAIRAALRDAKNRAKTRQSEDFQLAVDYAENRMLDDVRGLLLERYPGQNSGNESQKVQPVALPLTEKFAKEAATAYASPVVRQLVDKGTGEPAEDPSKEYSDAVGEVALDLHMYRMEKLLVLLRSMSVWWQSKRGILRPRIVPTHILHPVVSADIGEARRGDPADPEDYLGFIVELMHDIEDASSSAAPQCALLMRAEHVYYECQKGNPYDMAPGTDETFPQPFMWPQMVELESGQVTEQDLPLQMLTMFHTDIPVNSLIVDNDVTVVQANRELNVQWSALLDTLRRQGASQMVLDVMDPANPPQQLNYGAAFAIPVGPEEGAAFISATNNYTQMVDVLKQFVKVLAVMHSQNPSDFSTDGQAAMSGFAKAVEKLPQIQDARKRNQLLKLTEETMVYPRVASILKANGKLSFDPSKYKLRVTFTEQEIPKSVDETTKQQEHDFKHSISSPVHELKRKHGISLEEAEEMWAEHKKYTSSSQPSPQQSSPTMSSLFGGIGRTARPQRREEKKEYDDRTAPQRDR